MPYCVGKEDKKGKITQNPKLISEDLTQFIKIFDTQIHTFHKMLSDMMFRYHTIGQRKLHGSNILRNSMKTKQVRLVSRIITTRHKTLTI